MSTQDDIRYLQMAVDESRRCTSVMSAYSVGAVLVTAAGEIYKGYTHETSPMNHAEEEAIIKALAAGAALTSASMYASMEPCSERLSKPLSCSQLIINERFARIVYALNEPDCFVDGRGAEVLRLAGVEVVHIKELAPQVKEINRHILCQHAR